MKKMRPKKLETIERKHRKSLTLIFSLIVFSIICGAMVVGIWLTYLFLRLGWIGDLSSDINIRTVFLFIAVFSLAVGVLYCIVAGLMAVDIVPRKATGAALGVVGISSYIAAGLQDITSGYLIQGYMTTVDGVDMYNFGPVSWFWIVASVISFVLPVLNWKKIKSN